jgi:Lamin Tail Domain
MSKKSTFLTILLSLIIICSCEKTYGPKMTGIVINELMPVNSTTVTDNYGQYDDWIELYNLSSSVKDISGYYLSDSKSNKAKWQFPSGTSISEKGYLIIWADKDTTQLGLHANFKLSSLGEKVIFSNQDSIIIDEIVFPAQTLELSFSRVPNGTGEFKWKTPTYNRSNDSK